MSYILEALKKSEKKRQGEHNDLTHLATNETPEQERTPQRRPLWPLLLGLALVINAGIMLLIFWPSQSTIPDAPATASLPRTAQDQDISSPVGEIQESMNQNTVAPESKRMEETSTHDTQAPATTAEVPATQEDPRNSTPAEEHAQMEPREQNTSAVATPPITSEDEIQTTADAAEDITQDSPPTVTAPAPEPVPETSTPRTNMVAEPAPVRFSDLPLAYRSQLPEMHMSVHAYSETSTAALIRVNNKMLRPGGYLADGVRLEEITRDGAIFSYAGQRFLLPRR